MIKKVSDGSEESVLFHSLWKQEQCGSRFYWQCCSSKKCYSLFIKKSFSFVGALSSFFLFISLEMKASRNLHWRVALKEGSRVVMIFISIKGERGRSIAQRLWFFDCFLSACPGFKSRLYFEQGNLIFIKRIWDLVKRLEGKISSLWSVWGSHSIFPGIIFCRKEQYKGFKSIWLPQIRQCDGLFWLLPRLA